jgi:hypothetical protein
MLAAELVDRWRDTGPVLWAGAGAALTVWLAALAAFWLASEPRRVRPAPATLEPGGPEPPAVVNLVASDWELGHEALPATLLDLAARRHLSIDWLGERTLVRVRTAVAPDPAMRELTDYERMVLDHVRALSAQTADGFVPAEALTTGPDAVAKNWWTRFAKAVTRDARARGLSRPRVGARARTVLVALAVVVGIAVFVAATTLPESDDGDSPVGAAVGFGVISAALLIGAASRLRGERDTPEGRAAAARWLGLRTMLTDDPTFASQPPAAVAIWDRILAYGAALGVAHSAVAALPLGSESEREAWSSVGGHWRVVRVRYPSRIPPGYGRSPLLVAFVGLLLTALGILIAPATISLGDALLDSLDDITSDDSVPASLRAGVGIAVAVFVAFGAAVFLVGASMLVGGVADMVRGRRVVEGRVLRLRMRGDEQHRYWHLAVDDGTGTRVRAWRLAASPPVSQGAFVTARVTPWLRHVADLRHVTADARADGADGLAGAPVAAPTLAPPAAARLGAAGDVPGAAPPPLPDSPDIAAALGRPVTVEAGAAAHPLAIGPMASATYAGPEGERVVVAWVRPETIDGFRLLPRFVATPVPVGDEAYRAPLGGGLVARRGAHVLLVAPSLPGFDDVARDRAVESIARAALPATAPSDP